ncbi:hypothetical protein GUJ93_ZPchr0006g41813 [Zizania palustris]|uniref:Uncharacterized protein n=1 Tax=Zizania palustris TaxID=103762 RepID=A0A8J5TF90_ZIZPA|nr:hypothetical protein GUJ93_ZPchr0006g41813 [Zizania palustris]
MVPSAGEAAVETERRARFWWAQSGRRRMEGASVAFWAPARAFITAARDLLSAEGRQPSVAARWATTGGHGVATEGARAGQWRLRRGRTWCRRLRRGECGGGGIFEGGRAPSRCLRRRTATSSKRAACLAGGFGGGRRRLRRGACEATMCFEGGAGHSPVREPVEGKTEEEAMVGKALYGIFLLNFHLLLKTAGPAIEAHKTETMTTISPEIP